MPVCLTQATSVWAFTFFLMTISVFFLLPLIILVILYAIIAKNLITSDSKLKIRLSKPELSVKARKQVVLMLGAVVLSFFTCLLPFRVLTLWIIFVPEETFQSLNVETYYNLLYFCRIMWYLNSAVNPILYNLMSSKFRKGFFKLCRCWLIGRNRHAIRGRTRAQTFNTTTTSSYLTHSCCHHHNCHDMSESVCSASAATKKTLSLDDLRNMHTIVTQTKANIPRIVTSSSATNLNKIVHTLPRHTKHQFNIYNNGMKKPYHATSCGCSCCTCCCTCSSENYDEHNHKQQKEQAKPCSYRTAVVLCHTCTNSALPVTTTTKTTSSSHLLKNHIKENDLRKLAFKNSSVKRNARNVSFDETAIYANNQRNHKNNIKIQYRKQISLDEHLLRKKIINNGHNLNLVDNESKVQCKYGELQYVVKYIDETSNEESPQSFVPLLNGSGEV